MTEKMTEKMNNKEIIASMTENLKDEMQFVRPPLCMSDSEQSEAGSELAEVKPAQSEEAQSQEVKSEEAQSEEVKPAQSEASSARPLPKRYSLLRPRPPTQPPPLHLRTKRKHSNTVIGRLLNDMDGIVDSDSKCEEGHHLPASASPPWTPSPQFVDSGSECEEGPHPPASAPPLWKVSRK